jgi:hypothetical protein
VEPTTKLDPLPVLADLGAELVSYKTIDRHVRMIESGGYRDGVAERCSSYATDCGGLSLLLYDVTPLYFEAESEDDLRKVGYSNERRVDPQIVAALLVDHAGFPPGNRLRRMQHRRDYDHRPDRHQLHRTPRLKRRLDGGGC